MCSQLLFINVDGATLPSCYAVFLILTISTAFPLHKYFIFERVFPPILSLLLPFRHTLLTVTHFVHIKWTTCKNIAVYLSIHLYCYYFVISLSQRLSVMNLPTIHIPSKPFSLGYLVLHYSHVLENGG